MASSIQTMKSATSAEGPRKRRRRAPTTGATEDCFACRKRGAKCDRRRPYCTQCIEQGKDCSGYKTTLTWGVGVASRGKLRGLSLPVAKKPSPTSTPTSSPIDTRDASAASKKPVAKVSAAARGLTIDTRSTPTSIPTSAPNSAPPYPPQYNFINANPSPTHPIPIPNSAGLQQGWQVPGFSAHLANYSSSHEPPKRRHPFQHPSLHNLHTSFSPVYDEPPLSASTGSLSAYTDSNYGSPVEYPHTPSDVPFVDPLLNMHSNPYANQPSSMDSNESLPFGDGPPVSFADQLNVAAANVPATQPMQEFPDNAQNQMHPGSVGAASLSDLLYSSDMNSMQMSTDGLHLGFYGPNVDENQKQEDGANFSENSMSLLPRNAMPTNLFHLSPRTQFLLDYYSKHICSVLVAFDGSDNPYRSQVLHLAMTNEGLQNAISALVVNNIRMRGGKETALLGFEQQNPFPATQGTSKYAAQENRKVHGDPTPEELHYKAASINMLNAQLADPSRARDDAVLATLLILCLFHVSDSGFSKFKTQLAGVQKLLSMRESGLQSNFIGWIEMFFAWFDVMTSTVNDRETQIQSASLDMLDYSQNLGSLEHLSGCEGRLFKLIARLGRLNLLSQNRPVKIEEFNERTPQPTPAPLSLKKDKKEATDYYSLNFDRLDGNGWGTPMCSTPTSEFPPSASSPSDLSSSPSNPTSNQHHPNPDNRHEFWREWQDIRSRLQSWSLDSTTIPAADAPSPLSPLSASSTTSSSYAASSSSNLGGLSSLSSASPSPSQRALLHINESFRLAALLYTERLAYPSLPSSAPNFAGLVAAALDHIATIDASSCVLKFLLWPLFIVGTECVGEAQRQLVRERCVEIQRESGFFNNLSGLEVLERVWAEDDAMAGVGVGGEGADGGGAGGIGGFLDGGVGGDEDGWAG
ncbi:hypothetical protein EV356DRAFT_105258 [Viridothelium virens]|uniref:Zn(2)-C6 fungal-type domain-containing protein n=1 Tax=Viridothelium virens TaxID=1048519 RepID=A0A6A6HP87_VIRVR|nr:hypothetical protein EV356DRAFT_105258 [Viridothelium virens]